MPNKTLPLNDCDVKFADEGKGQFEGYLSIFNNVDLVGDTVMKGAFTETLKGRKSLPPMLLNHNRMGIPVGKWLSMKEDGTGLRVKGELTPGNRESEQVYAALKHGAMSGLSIGYRPELFEKNDKGGLNLLRVKLNEGSIVSMPAEDSARIDAVKIEEFGEIETYRDFEEVLREAEFSREAAKSLIRRFKELNQREADELREQNKALESELSTYRSKEAREASFVGAANLLENMKSNA